MPRLAEGEFALVRDHLGKAIQTPTDPVRWGSGMTDLDFHVLCAEVAAQAREADGLAEHAPLAEAGARRLRHRLYSGVAHCAHAVALLLGGKPGGAIQRYDQAIEVFTALGTRWQLGRTLVGRAEAHTSAGDLTSARADYARALEAFEAVGAAPAAAQARRTLQGMA